ncbi:hypothetical protein NPIL_222581 [Nephila pilipes]|uniref:Uncharacterized protein n=1 Tax=Nephila pilipes TaxID=299642 RepID=A0A8X6TVG7_NEPPI|nr:hypothetical protein NPIL_222581 [Nephila pilipes]
MKLGLTSSTYEYPKCGDNMRLCERSSAKNDFEWRCKKRGENPHYVCRSVRHTTEGIRHFDDKLSRRLEIDIAWNPLYSGSFLSCLESPRKIQRCELPGFLLVQH